MFDSDDVVFVWAVGKAMLIVIVSAAALVYLAWAVTWKREIGAHAIASKTNGESEGTGQIVPATTADRNKTGEPERSGAA